MPEFDTGHGATIAFTTSAFTGKFTMIGGAEVTREKLDKTHLGSGASREYREGDVADPGEFDVEIFFNPGATGTNFPPITAAAETITIDLDGAGSAGAILAGTGFFIMAKQPELQTDVIMKCSGRIAWASLPAWTDEP